MWTFAYQNLYEPNTVLIIIFLIIAEYIQVIMSMEQSVQHVVMTAIQELMTAREAAGVDTEQYKELEQQVT